MEINKNPSLKSPIIVATIFILLTLVLTFIKTIEAVAEWWSRYISRFYRTVIGKVSSSVSFPLTELFIILAVILGLVFLVLIISNLIKKHPKKSLQLLLKAVAIISIFVFIYTATASMEYYRSPLPSADYDSATVTKEEFLTVSRFYQSRYNELATILPRDKDGYLEETYSFEETVKAVTDAYHSLIDDDYFGEVLSAKSLLATKEMFASFGISGIYFSITSESNVNLANTYYSEIPLTVAHEIAHSMGVMRENEANVLAFYVCLNSGNDYLEYSALEYGIGFLQNGVKEIYSQSSDEYKSFIKGYSALIMKDYDKEYELYQKYKNPFREIATFFNDIYLKLSGMSEGTDSYTKDNSAVEKEESHDTEGNPTIIIKSIKYGDIQKIFISRFLRLSPSST